MRQQTLRSAIKDRPESGDAAAAAAFARSRTGPDTTGGVRGRMLFEDDPPAAAFPMRLAAFSISTWGNCLGRSQGVANAYLLPKFSVVIRAEK